MGRKPAGTINRLMDAVGGNDNDDDADYIRCGGQRNSMRRAVAFNRVTHVRFIYYTHTNMYIYTLYYNIYKLFAPFGSARKWKRRRRRGAAILNVRTHTVRYR